MIDIKFDFDSKKFERSLKKQVEQEALSQTKRKLRDLISRGLSVRLSRGSIVLNGSDELIEEATKRLD